jgi:hypothetical protein
LNYDDDDDDTYRRLEFCEWFLHVCNERESFPHFIVWSDEANFKLCGTVSRHNCVYWAAENPHITQEQAVDLPGVSVWCGLSSGGMTEPFSLNVLSQVLPA